MSAPPESPVSLGDPNRLSLSVLLISIAAVLIVAILFVAAIHKSYKAATDSRQPARTTSGLAVPFHPKPSPLRPMTLQASVKPTR